MHNNLALCPCCLLRSHSLSTECKLVVSSCSCKKLGDDAMAAIAQLTRLQVLKLSECELISNNGETRTNPIS